MAGLRSPARGIILARAGRSRLTAHRGFPAGVILGRGRLQQTPRPRGAWRNPCEFPGDRDTVPVRPKRVATRRGDRPNPVVEFAGGIGEGLYDVAEGTAETVRSVLTTNPVTTVRNFGRGMAGMIEGAIAAEDTPARIQVVRAVDAIANATPRDIGRATGSVVGNAALGAVPGAALAKLSKLRRLRGARPPISYDPPEIGWAKENLGSDDKAWKRYNDAAPGARVGQAPFLMRTMEDGSKRPVKFDGVVAGEYLIDRKFRVVNRPRARAQLLRQSEALAEHRLIGTWEVPNEKELIAARKLLREMNVGNIRVRVAEP